MVRVSATEVYKVSRPEGFELRQRICFSFRLDRVAENRVAWRIDSLCYKFATADIAECGKEGGIDKSRTRDGGYNISA